MASIAFLALAFVFMLIINKLPPGVRVPFCTVIFTLLLTPSLLPTHLFNIPFPFGGVMVSLLGGETDFTEVVDLILKTLWWHIPAFICTGFLSYKLAYKFFGS